MAHQATGAERGRVSLGNLVLPVDPAPGFGGLLLGAVVAGHIGDVPDDFIPDVHRLIDQVDPAAACCRTPPAPPLPGRPPATVCPVDVSPGTG